MSGKAPMKSRYRIDAFLSDEAPVAGASPGVSTALHRCQDGAPTGFRTVSGPVPRPVSGPESGQQRGGREELHADRDGALVHVEIALVQITLDGLADRL